MHSDRNLNAKEKSGVRRVTRLMMNPNDRLAFLDLQLHLLYHLQLRPPLLNSIPTLLIQPLVHRPIQPIQLILIIMRRPCPALVLHLGLLERRSRIDPATRQLPSLAYAERKMNGGLTPW